MRRWVPATVATGTFVLFACAALSQSLPPDVSYRPLPSQPFWVVRGADEAQKPAVMQRQLSLLQARYDLSDRPIAGVFMSGGRKAVQGGVGSSYLKT
jgi:hypothetical protein